MTSKKIAAVIGAGPCGLGACKALKEEGIEPVCFEKTGHIGGLWRYHDEDVDGIASVMKSTIINTSKEIGAASDCPPPAEYPNYMHHTLMYEYISMLAEKTDCLKYVRYHHETQKIEEAKDYEETGRWVVTNKNTETGKVESEEFDFVAVCIGHHVYPNIPNFSNQKNFEGRILHTHSLKKCDGFEDQKVVVVGVGNSGMDAAVELSSVTKQVYLSSRRGAWILPRVGPKGYPYDCLFLRRHLNFLLRTLPYNMVCDFSEKALNERFDHALYNIKPKHRVWSQHPTVSDSIPIKLLSGVVVTRGAIKKFTNKGVIFEGEEEETEVDSVVLATGYQVKFPFLSENIIRVIDNRVRLYKFIFSPFLTHPTLAILGLIQPNGPGFPVGEMQCRWTARVMAGKLKLPSRYEMLKDIKTKGVFNSERFVSSPRHTLQVDFVGYTDELAAEIGVKPNLLKFAFTDPKLFKALVFGPCLPYQYRLQGPHSWDGARNAILTYRERVTKPLERPNQPKRCRQQKHFLKGKLIRLMILLVILYHLYYWFF